MSRPAQDTHDPIRELITRFLELHIGRNSTEVARLTGFNHSTISQWRRGVMPKVLQEATRQRLVEEVGDAPLERILEESPITGAEIRELWHLHQTSMQMLRAVHDIQHKIAIRMQRFGDLAAPPITPSQAAVEDGAAALRAAERGELVTVKRPADPKAKRRPA